MNIASMGPGLHPATTPQRCLCQRVACTPDAISAPTTAYSPALQRPVSKQRVTSPISQLAGVQQDHPGVWPSQPAPQIDRVAQRPPPPPQQQQQQHFQDTLQQAAARSAPDAAAGSDRGSSVATGSSGVQQSATTSGPGKQLGTRHKQHLASTTQLASSMQPQPAAPPRPPCKYTPCGKRDGQKLAASVSSRLQRGQQVLLPAGTGMQLVRTTAMLSSARTMLLSRDSSTGLVFQPSFSAAAGAAAMAAHQQQAERRQRARTAVAGSGYASSQLQQASAGGDIGAHVRSSHGNSNSSSSSKGVMLLVASVAEAQLRRFDQRPLIAARSTHAAALAGAAFARLCKQGYTSVRAAGPEATRLAMLAAAEARSKLLGCGLDLAVVPATDQVDIEVLAGPAGSSQYLDVEGVAPGEELPKQFVQVTVLHLVRCEPQQPGRLLPWPVPAEQLPAARHRQQQQQQAAPLPAQQPRDVSSQQQVGAWRSGLLAASAQQAPQQPAGLGGYQQHPSAPHLQPSPVLVTGSTSSSSSGSSSDPLLAHAANSVVPSSPLLLPRQQSGAVVGWSAAGGCDGDVLLGAADQLPSLQHDAATLPSQASSMGRQAGGLLLQHKAHSKKGSRQLVAAAQAGSSTGSRGSSS